MNTKTKNALIGGSLAGTATLFGPLGVFAWGVMAVGFPLQANNVRGKKTKITWPMAAGAVSLIVGGLGWHMHKGKDAALREVFREIAKQINDKNDHASAEANYGSFLDWANRDRIDVTAQKQFKIGDYRSCEGIPAELRITSTDRNGTVTSEKQAGCILSKQPGLTL